MEKGDLTIHFGLTITELFTFETGSRILFIGLVVKM